MTHVADRLKAWLIGLRAALRRSGVSCLRLHIWLGCCLGATIALACCAYTWAQDPPPSSPPAAHMPSPSGGTTAEAHAAISRGLAYLASTQERDGSWSNRGGYGEYPVAMTSLAGLAMLMDGNTTTQGRYAPHVDRAARFLVQTSTPDGLIGGGKAEPRPMYGHGFGMLFLSQLYGMTEDVQRTQTLHDILTRGVDLTGRAQSVLGGWMYTPDAQRDEGSVTITQVQALRSCRNVGIAVPKDVIDKAMSYLEISQNTDGGIRYTASQTYGGSRPPITAAAVCCWFNAGLYDNDDAHRALAYCKTTIQPHATVGGHDYYAHLYLAQALYIGQDAGWDEYYAKRRDYLLAQQEPDGSWWGDQIGDIYGTAVALIVLQLPYNQLPIMQP